MGNHFEKNQVSCSEIKKGKSRTRTPKNRPDVSDSNYEIDHYENDYEVPINLISWTKFGSQSKNLKVDLNLNNFIPYITKYRLARVFILESGHINKNFRGPNLIRLPVSHTRDTMKKIFISILKLKVLRRLEIRVQNEFLNMALLRKLFERLAKNPGLQILKLYTFDGAHNVKITSKSDCLDFLFKSLKRGYFKRLHTFQLVPSNCRLKSNNLLSIFYTSKYNLLPINVSHYFSFTKRIRRWQNFSVTSSCKLFNILQANPRQLSHVSSLEFFLDITSNFNIFAQINQMKNLVSLIFRNYISDYRDDYVSSFKSLSRLEKLNHLQVDIKCVSHSDTIVIEHINALLSLTNLKTLHLKMGYGDPSAKKEKEMARKFVVNNKIEVLKLGIDNFNTYLLQLAKTILKSASWNQLKKLHLNVFEESLKYGNLIEDLESLAISKESLKFSCIILERKEFREIYAF